MSICRLCKIHNFVLWDGLFSIWTIIKHYFKAHFVLKQTRKKFAIFDQSRGLMPVKKSDYGNWRLCKINIFYSLGKLVL